MSAPEETEFDHLVDHRGARNAAWTWVAGRCGFFGGLVVVALMALLYSEIFVSGWEIVPFVFICAVVFGTVFTTVMRVVGWISLRVPDRAHLPVLIGLAVLVSVLPGLIALGFRFEVAGQAFWVFGPLAVTIVTLVVHLRRTRRQALA